MSLLHRLRPSTAPLSNEELVDAYPWPDAGRWIRAMMVTTLDGAAAGPDGLTGSISSAADKQVFHSVRRYADAVLIGAETLRTERYKPMRAKPADADARVQAGQLPAPVLVVASRSLALPWELPIWSESTHRPVVVTGTHAAPDRLATAREHADVIALDDLAPAVIVDSLVDRGLRRIVCEGGPRLLRNLTAAGLVDEVDITIAPLLTGTGTTSATDSIQPPADYQLAHVLESDGFLMTRFVRQAPSA